MDRARAFPTARESAYWALAEWFVCAAALVEAGPSFALEKLRATIEEHIVDAEEQRYVEPRLSTCSVWKKGVAGDQENLFGGVAHPLRTAGEQGPTILVFEDMHWADAGLIDFLRYLLDWSRTHALFVVAARPA